MLNTSFVISAAHPSLPGHFPDQPITPGVVTLDYVACGLLEQIPGAHLEGFPQVKFFTPLLPEVEVSVIYNPKSETLYHFSCEENGKVFLSGQIKLTIVEA